MPRGPYPSEGPEPRACGLGVLGAILGGTSGIARQVGREGRAGLRVTWLKGRGAAGGRSQLHTAPQKGRPGAASAANPKPIGVSPGEAGGGPVSITVPWTALVAPQILTLTGRQSPTGAFPDRRCCPHFPPPPTSAVPGAWALSHCGASALCLHTLSRLPAPEPLFQPHNLATLLAQEPSPTLGVLRAQLQVDACEQVRATGVPAAPTPAGLGPTHRGGRGPERGQHSRR